MEQKKKEKQNKFNKMASKTKSSNSSKKNSVYIERMLDIVLKTPPKSINPSGALYSIEDDIHVESSKKTQNYKVYSFFKDLTAEIGEESKNIIKAISNKRIYQLIEKLKIDDITERNGIKLFILEISRAIPYARNKVYLYLFNEIILYLENLRTHVGLDTIIDLIKEYLKNNYIEIDDKFYILYSEILLKLMCMPLFENSESIVEFIDLLGRLFPYTIFITIKCCKKLFYKVRYMAKVIIIKIIIRIIGYISDETYIKIEEDLCYIINISFTSDHIVLIEETSSIVLSAKSKYIIFKNMNTFLPKIFNSMYTLSKSNLIGLTTFFKAFYLVVRLHHPTFEKCLKNYNFKKLESA